MDMLLSNKSRLEMSKLIRSLVKTTSFIPAAFVLGWAAFFGVLASLFGLSGPDHALNFISAAAHNWILITLNFLLLPYFIATIFFNIIRPPESRGNLVSLFNLSGINIRLLALTASLSIRVLDSGTSPHHYKHVPGFSPQLE